jgi:hypothetical protein
MNIIMFVYVFALFFVLTPDILTHLPPRGSLIITALTHAFVFSLILYFTCKIIYQATSDILEGESPMIFPVVVGKNRQPISTSPLPAMAPVKTP